MQSGVDPADAITTIRALLQTEINYYHPRIAVWEPLLEPSHLCFLVEWQNASTVNASTVRQGQLAVEASDRVLGGSVAGGQTPSLAVDSPRIVSLNLTDSVVDTLARTIKEWREWRKVSQVWQQLDEGYLGNAPSEEESLSGLDSKEPVAPFTPMALSEGEPKRPRVDHPDNLDTSGLPRAVKVAAARKGAKAALVFAKRRGAGKQNKSESAKPFIFKNRTGMAFMFTQHKHLEESKIIFNSLLVMLTEKQGGSHERPTGTTPMYLADGSDTRFHIDIVSRDRPANEKSTVS
jgi:hypothetical protein